MHVTSMRETRGGGLERVAPEDIADALCDLRDIGGPVTVTIDAAPDPSWSGTHLTVRPLSTWRRMFDRAGFDIRDEVDEPDTAPESDEWSIRRHWMRLNPFRDERGARRRSFHLRPRADAPSREDVRLTTRRLLGSRPVVAAPRGIGDADAQLVFLIGTYQEFRQYLAIWPSLPRGSFSVVLRTGLLGDAWQRRERMIVAWLQARGISVECVRSVRDVSWASGSGRRTVLVTGAESSAYESHLWNAAIVVTACAHGWRTIQLQHGIWPYADLQRPMTMYSHVMCTWGDELALAMREVVAWPDGTRRARSVDTDIRYVPTGNPLFDRYADADVVRLEDMLGDWVGTFTRRVLVATNLHWTQHANGSRVDPAVLTMARAMPETLFLVKLHPVHDVDEQVLSAVPSNVQILDEFVCLAADLDSPRLVSATDAVVATQSTVVLEAALGRKPYTVMDSGNPNRYEHVAVTPIDRLADRVRWDEPPADAEQFRARYYDVASLGAATARVLDVIAAELRCADPSRSDVSVGLARFAESASVYAGEWLATQAAFANAEAAYHALDAHRRVLDARIGELEQTEARLFADIQAQGRWIADELAAAGRRLDAERGWRVAIERVQVQAAFDAALRRGDRTVRVGLFGASLAGQRQLARLRAMPGVEVSCFFDNDATLHATAPGGVPVLEPDAAAFEAVDLILVCTAQVEAVVDQVGRAGHADKLLYDARAFDRSRLPAQSA